MGFWTDNFYEPKFSDRFVAELMLDEDYIVNWYNIISVDVPSFKVDTESYFLLNREIKFPTNIKWNPITITIAETIDNKLLFYLRKHYGGHYDETGHWLYKHDYMLDSTVSKDRSFSNKMTLKQYRAGEPTPKGEKEDEKHLLETWEITNFHVSSISFSNASYKDGEIRVATLQIEYDWAYLGLNGDSAKAPEIEREPEVIIEDPVMKKGKWKQEIPEQKAKEQKARDNPIPPPPINLKNPPKTKKEVQKVEQDLQKYMGTNTPNKEKLKFPERRPVKPVDRMVENKKKEKKRGNLTPAGRRFITNGDT